MCRFHRATVRSPARGWRPVDGEIDVAAFISAALPDDDGPLPAVRTRRAQLIEEGRLLDASATARAAGIMLPVAISREVFLDCVAWSDEDNARKGIDLDMAGRLWELVWLLRAALLAGPIVGDRAERAVQLMRVPRAGPGRQHEPVTLMMLLDDVGGPSLTVAQPGETYGVS